MLAHSLYRNLPPALGTADLGERIQNISVLRHATCPAVLAEPSYLTNDEEAQRLLRPDFRQQVAAAIAQGVQDYARLIDTLAGGAGPNPQK